MKTIKKTLYHLTWYMDRAITGIWTHNIKYAIITQIVRMEDPSHGEKLTYPAGLSNN